jgi:hypothetical protein
MQRDRAGVRGIQLGEAGSPRRAIGKKIKKLLDEQREKFMEGALAKGTQEELAEKIFDDSSNRSRATDSTNPMPWATPHRLRNRVPEGKLSRRIHGGAAQLRCAKHRARDDRNRGVSHDGTFGAAAGYQ